MKKNRELEARNWLKQAQAEFNDAVHLQDHGSFYLALFLFQQATEKALKAYLFLKGERELYTHSVNDLIGIAKSHDPTFSQIEVVRILDRYYITTRYPNGLAGNTPAEFFNDLNEAQEAQDHAQKALSFIKKKLKSILPA